MQNSAWKLTALAGVVALGFFAVVQTQRGLLSEKPGDSGEETSAKADGGNKQGLPILSAPNNGGGLMLAQNEPGGNPFDTSGKSDESVTPVFGDPPAKKSPVTPAAKKDEPKSAGGNPFDLGSGDGEKNKKQDPEPPAKKKQDAFPSFGEVKTKPAPEKKDPGNEPAGVINLNDKKDASKNDDAAKKETKSPGPNLGGGFPAGKIDPPKKSDAGKSTGGNPFDIPDTGKSDGAKSTGEKKVDPPTPAFGAPQPKSVTPRPKSVGSEPVKNTTGGNPFGAPTTGNDAAKKADADNKRTTGTPSISTAPVKEEDKKTMPVPSIPNFGGPETKSQPKTTEPAKGAATGALTPTPETKSTPLTPIKEAGLQAVPKTQTPTRLGSYQVVPRTAARPQLTITKQAPTNAVLGKPFVYDIIIKNTGTGAAHQVVVQDPVPAGVRLEGSDPQAVLSNNKLTWKLGSVAAGKSVRISVKVTPQRAGQIGSVATVNFVSEVAARAPAKGPKLSLDFDGPTTGKVGQTVTFTFKVTNNGTTEARDVWIRDIIPDGLQHPGGDDLEYQVGTLAPGKTETVKLNMKVVKAGKLTNRAIVTAAGGVRMESKVAMNVSGSKLIITRAGPKKRYIGVKALYQNMVTNNSTETVDGATLTETVPQGMDFVQATDGGRYDPRKRTVTWIVGKLGPRQSRTYKLVLLPKQAGIKSSVVQAGGRGVGMVRTASATTIEGYAALGVDVPAIERPVSVGEQLSFRVVGRNRGTIASKNVRLQVTLPAQLSLVAIRGRGKYAKQGQVITFEPVGTLGVNDKLAFDLILKAVNPGDLRVKVQIQSDEMTKPLQREEAVRVLGN